MATGVLVHDMVLYYIFCVYYIRQVKIKLHMHNYKPSTITTRELQISKRGYILKQSVSGVGATPETSKMSQVSKSTTSSRSKSSGNSNTDSDVNEISPTKPITTLTSPEITVVCDVNNANYNSGSLAPVNSNIDEVGSSHSVHFQSSVSVTDRSHNNNNNTTTNNNSNNNMNGINQNKDDESKVTKASKENNHNYNGDTTIGSMAGTKILISNSDHDRGASASTNASTNASASSGGTGINKSKRRRMLRQSDNGNYNLVQQKEKEKEKEKEKLRLVYKGLLRQFRVTFLSIAVCAIDLIINTIWMDYNTLWIFMIDSSIIVTLNFLAFRDSIMFVQRNFEWIKSVSCDSCSVFIDLCCCMRESTVGLDKDDTFMTTMTTSPTEAVCTNKTKNFPTEDSFLTQSTSNTTNTITKMDENTNFKI